MPDGAAGIGQRAGSDAGDLLQLLDQVVGIRAANRGLGDQLVDLLHEHGRLEMLHAIVDAAGEKSFAVEGRGGAAAVVVGEAAVQQLVAVAGHGAAFARGKVLGVLEAEAAQVAERAALSAAVLGQPRLAGVLDHRQPAPLGDGVDRVHLAGHAVDVDRHDGPRAVGDAALDRGRVHRKRGRVGVGEHRQRLVRQDRVVGGDEREGRADDLVARIDARDVQAR